MTIDKRQVTREIRGKGYYHGVIMGVIMGLSWDYHRIIMGLSWDYHGIITGLSRDYHGIIMEYLGGIGSLGSLEQSNVLPLGVELKLRHWPSTALSFISRLTNMKPVFCHLQY